MHEVTPGSRVKVLYGNMQLVIVRIIVTILLLIVYLSDLIWTMWFGNFSIWPPETACAVNDVKLLITFINKSVFSQGRPDINDPGYPTAPNKSGFTLEPPVMGCCFVARRIYNSAGLITSTIEINLHNLAALAPDAHAAINRTAIKQHRINPVSIKPH